VLATPTSKSLSADDLVNFDRFIARQLLVGLEDEIETLTSNSVAWIYEHLGPDYSWPGNISALRSAFTNEAENTTRFANEVESRRPV
jgi:hypothetical protein